MIARGAVVRALIVALEAALEAATGSDWSGYLADMLAS